MNGEHQIIDREQLLAHGAWIKALAHSMVFDQARVDDLVQETWLVALDRQPRDIRNPRAWLAGILRNVVRREARGDRRRRRREQLVARPERDDGDQDLVARAEWHRVLVDAVLKLREPYRSAILAIDLEGATTASVAKRMGVSAATMRSRRARALQMLRERLDDDHGDRRCWSLALLPLALQASTASAGTPVLQRLIESVMSTSEGALIMSVKLKSVLGLVTVAAILTAVWLPSASEVANDTENAAVVRPVLPVATTPAALLDLAPEASAPALLAVAPPEPQAVQVGSPITFSGRVIDLRGLPVSGARINLLSDGWTLAALGFEGLATGRDDLDPDLFVTPDDEPWNRFPAVITDGEGNFDLTASLVLWGERTWLQSSYRFPELIITHPDFATLFHACLDRDGDRILVGELALQPAATLAARVIGAYGEPLPHVLVSIDPDDTATRQPAVQGQYGWGVEAGFRKELTGADGTFEIGGLAPGSWTVRLTANDRLALEIEDIALSSPGTRHLGDIVLGSGGQVAGLVVDDSGAPVAGAKIFALHHPSQYAPPEQPAELATALALLREGARPWVEIAQATGASLTCRFVTATGETVHHRQLAAYVFGPDVTSPGRLARTATKWSQNDEGQVSFPALAPGRVQVLLFASTDDLPEDFDEMRPHAVGELTVDLPAGATVERDVVLR